MTADSLRGVALLQRGDEDLIAVARGTTGTSPDADCTLATRFQVASVTKQFTAAAVLLLADRGILSVEDPVSRWLVDCPPAWDSITLHHLLSHTAGLAHWDRLPGVDVTKPVGTDEKLRVFAEAPLLGPPGEHFSYSSPGYVLLAHIVELATVQHYQGFKSFMAEELFGPLGMDATFDGNPTGQTGLAAGHQDGKPVDSFDLDTVGMGTGSVWSTAGDLARWDRALFGGGVVSEAAVAAMFTVHAPAQDDDGVVRTEGYGYGWFIGTAAGRRLFYHPGDNPGFRSINAVFPHDGVRLAVLSNEGATGLDPVTHELIRIAFPG